ncbi:hypothetical protein IFM47457_10859 [Aspergillus lentulus]|nr:hypothetical protein IFM47457_10859 [Aspergillus lentulus]
MDSTAKDLADGIVNNVKQNMTAALERVSDTLSLARADANRLGLPAAGTFSMKDPIFHQKGDLLVKLEYNGINSTEPPGPHPMGNTDSIHQH